MMKKLFLGFLTLMALLIALAGGQSVQPPRTALNNPTPTPLDYARWGS
jgi:hypothetical protein